MAAADVLYEVMTIMVKRGPLSVKEQEAWEERNGKEVVEGEGEEKKYVGEKAEM